MAGSTWTWIGGTIDLESPSDWTLTVGPGNATGIPETGDTAINAGNLVGDGSIAASIVNNGTIEASNNSAPGSSTGGDLVIQGTVSGTGSITIAPGATLQIDGSLGTGQTIAFSPGAPETLILGSPTGTISNPITGFAQGDRIEFSNGVHITSVAVLNGGTTLAVAYSSTGGTVGTYDLTDIAYAAGTPLDIGYLPPRYLAWVVTSSPCPPSRRIPLRHVSLLG